MIASRAERSGSGARRRLRQAWSDRPLRTKGLVVIALPMLILLLALVWVGLTTHREDMAEDEVQRTLQVEFDLERLEAVVYRAAAVSRLQAGSASAAVATARAAVPRLLADLAAEVRDPEQRDRLRRVDPLARRAVALMPAPTGADGRLASVLDAFDHELAAMRDREAVLLAARINRGDRARSTNLTITYAAGVVGVLGSVAGVWLFSTGVIRRVAFLETNAHRLSRGEPLMAAPGGADEIGRLGSALDEASGLLSDRQRRLEELVARLFRVQEDERRRVAYDLHDGLAQVAAAAHQHLQAYAERFPPDAGDAQLALERGLALVQRTVRETRAAIAGLRPTALDDFGLSLALRLEVDALRPHLREAVFEGGLGGRRLSPVLETALFRIAQEALVNVRKHAGAAAGVLLRLEACEGRVRLSVLDDGVGFDLAGSNSAWNPAGQRVGLEAMRERAALLGGELHVSSAPGEGTRIDVEINGA